jgi:hypothetical protein
MWEPQPLAILRASTACTGITLPSLYIIISSQRHIQASGKRKSYPCNRPWRPVGLWDVEAPTFSGQSAHRWWWGCRPYATASRSLPGLRFLVLISIKGWVDHRAIVRLEVLDQLKDSILSSGIEPETFRVLTESPNISLSPARKALNPFTYTV